MKDRERRVNAGNRMKKLLEEEGGLEDSFYKVYYGGFEDSEEDNDFVIDDSELASDSDSDSSSDHESSSKRKPRTMTKAYKEPESSQINIEKPKPDRPKENGALPSLEKYYDCNDVLKSTPDEPDSQPPQICELDEKKGLKRPREEE